MWWRPALTMCAAPNTILAAGNSARLGLCQHRAGIAGHDSRSGRRADPRFDRHAVHVAASRTRDETRLVLDCSQINALLSSGLPLDRAQKGEPASVEDRRALLAGRLSNEFAKTSTIAVIKQATPPAKQANRLRSRQSADRTMQPPTVLPAAREDARAAPRSTARARDRELDYGR
jgi:hypothetical protein